jgi:hypothetical protein
MAAPELHPGGKILLFRFNGFGARLVGRLEVPELAPWVLKQYAVTVCFIPIYLGRFYAVQPGPQFGSWSVAGWLSDKEAAARVGRRAYWLFKLRVFALPLLVIALVLGAFRFGPALDGLAAR